jgi:hypothetical protein
VATRLGERLARRLLRGVLVLERLPRLAARLLELLLARGALLLRRALQLLGRLLLFLGRLLRLLVLLESAAAEGAMGVMAAEGGGGS